jgi:8-oxo-dGTP pyrophosphatase MutT (NUDIX family)
LLRPLEAEFAASAVVFPGGRVDAQDSAPEWEKLTGLTEGDAQELLGYSPGEGEPGARALLAGAVREVFEESAILLGSDLDPAVLAEARGRVHRGELALHALLAELGVHLQLNDVVYFARWVTPEIMPRRFDTHFFAARTSPGHDAVPAPREVAALEWLRPSEALDRADRGEAQVLPPTRAMLTAIGRYDDVDTALAGLRATRDLRPILPKVLTHGVEITDSNFRVLIPGDPGYDEA